MLVFMDTEFTGLHQNTTLISLGLVDQDNRMFYAEFLDYDQTQVDDWIVKNVLDHLIIDKIGTGLLDNPWKDATMIKDTKRKVVPLLNRWLSECKGSKLQLVSDVCHYDMMLFCELFGGALSLGERISPYCHDLNGDLARHLGKTFAETFDISREEFSKMKNEKLRHNALYDVIVIKRCWERMYPPNQIHSKNHPMFTGW